MEASASALEDPGCVMAGVFVAYLALMSTEEHAVAGARHALACVTGPDAVGPVTARPRERAHLAAARAEDLARQIRAAAR